MVVWKPGRRWHIGRLGIGAMFLCLALAYFTRSGLTERVCWPLATAALFIPHGLWRLSRTWITVMVSGGTVRIHHRDGRMESVDLSRISGVKVERVVGNVMILSDDRPPRQILPFDFFDGSKDARRFACDLLDQVKLQAWEVERSSGVGCDHAQSGG